MCEMLIRCGTELTGYSLNPPTEPSLFELCHTAERMHSVSGDIRDLESLKRAMNDAKPEIVIHMAAQPIVRDSYKDPVYTYETNVMGTVNLLEAVRCCDSVKSVVNVTTDKVYLNKEWEWGYREDEELNGFDPYSNSKSCSELVTSCYRNSFFGGDTHKAEDGRTVVISTCRAGNVIGGGDFANDRIIPDCIRAIQQRKQIVVRNPYSTRPYQHVLEPVTMYLYLAQKQYEDPKCAGSYNIGPEETDCYSTGELTDLFCRKWNAAIYGTDLPILSWIDKSDGGPHEAGFLKLDCSRAKRVLGWKPVWNVETALDKIVDFSMVYFSDPLKTAECVAEQIDAFVRS